MEIKIYKMLFARWAWIFIVALIIGGLSGYIGSQFVTPAYRANTKVMIFRTQQDENSELANLNNQQLVQTYLEILISDPIIEEVTIRVNHDINPSENVRVLQIQDTQFIQISVVDDDPEMAASFANTLVDVLIEQNESIQIDRYFTTEENLNHRKTQIEEQILQLRMEFTQISKEDVQNQLVQVNSQILLLEEEITTLYKEIAELGPTALFTTQNRIDHADKEARLSQIQPLILQYQQIRTDLEIFGRPNISGPNLENLRLEQLQGTIDLYQVVHLDILRSIESIQLLRLQNTPNILQIEAASPPKNAFRPIPILFAIIGSTIGLAIASLVAYITESLDDTLKSIEDIQQTLGLPVLGTMNEKELISMSRMGRLTKDGSFPIPNNINSLLINLEFVNEISGKAPKSLIIASVNPDSYKSIIIAYIAMSYAQMGKNVVLIDANMQQPQVHKYLGVPNKEGLMDMLTGKLTIGKIGTTLDQLRKMTVITGGNTTMPQSGLLKSNKMDKLLEEFNEKYDMVLMDSPPLQLSDTWILASKIETTLLVIRPGHTQPSEAQAAANNLTRAGANIVGVVLTRIPPKLEHFYSQSVDISLI